MNSNEESDNKIELPSELSLNQIIDEFFKFIKNHFDDFNQQKSQTQNWWTYNSWSPFVQTYFIILGRKQNLFVGASFTAKTTTTEIKKFMIKIGIIPDIKDFIKPPDLCFDVSWHDNYKFILGLEHEETTTTTTDIDKGNVADNQLEHIFNELEKLRMYNGNFKIIVSRPRLRKIHKRKDTYPEVIKYFQNNIETKLSNIHPPENEKWIVILVCPEYNLQSPGEETKILFYCNIWNGNKLSSLKECSFKVRMNVNGQVRKI